MVKFIKKTLIENDNVCRNSYNLVFQPIFYILGIINDLSTLILEYFNITKRISSHHLKQIIDEKGISIDILIRYFRRIYKESVFEFETTIKSCFYINQIIKLLTKFKIKQKSIIYSTEIVSIIDTLVHYAHHEILLHTSAWYSSFCTNHHDYWPNLLPMKSNSFSFTRNAKGRIINGSFIQNNQYSDPNIEFWIIPINNHKDHVRFTYEIDTDIVHIGWQKTDSHEWFCDLICDNIFYAQGGHLCRIYFTTQQRVKNKQVIVHPVTKNITNIQEFINILNTISSGEDEFREIETPWGNISFNTQDLIDYEDLPAYFQGDIITK